MMATVQEEREAAIARRAGADAEAKRKGRALRVLELRWNADEAELREAIGIVYPKLEGDDIEALLLDALHFQRTERTKIDPRSVRVRPPEFEKKVRRGKAAAPVIDELVAEIDGDLVGPDDDVDDDVAEDVGVNVGEDVGVTIDPPEALEAEDKPMTATKSDLFRAYDPSSTDRAKALDIRDRLKSEDRLKQATMLERVTALRKAIEVELGVSMTQNQAQHIHYLKPRPAESSETDIIKTESVSDPADNTVAEASTPAETESATVSDQPSRNGNGAHSSSVLIVPPGFPAVPSIVEEDKYVRPEYVRVEMDEGYWWLDVSLRFSDIAAAAAYAGGLFEGLKRRSSQTSPVDG